MHAPERPVPCAETDVLEVGGRLTEPSSQRLIASAFADELKSQQGLFDGVSLADLAHTLVMSESGPIPKDASRSLLRALLELHERPGDFELDPAKGDIYTNREAWLNVHCDAAGWLGPARARREAITCGFHLTVQCRLLALAEGLGALAQALNKAARRHRAVLFPDYTYLQAAQPTTFGHYLLGFAFPILRHIERALVLFERFNTSPAGGGSSNGSITPQDRAKLARLLGFERPAANTRDAMWQADLVIEAAGLTTNLLITLDRLGEDLMVFASQEFGLITLSDAHSRASKIMPQKRNPFALAYLRALANRAIGLQAATAAAMRTPSGQMDNRLAAYGEIPVALDQATNAVGLMAEVISGLHVNKARAKAILEDGALAASDLAEYVMLASGLNFRQAHKVVGHLVRTLDDEERTLASATSGDLDLATQTVFGRSLSLGSDILARALDSQQAIKARTCIGGAAVHRIDEAVKTLANAVTQHRRIIRNHAARIERARHKLIETAQGAAD